MNNELNNVNNVNNEILLSESDDKKAQEEILALKKQIQHLEQEVATLKVEKYKTPVYQYLYEERLCPPAYQPSEEEIQLAKARYVFDNEVWQIVYYLKSYIESLEGQEVKFPYTKESVEKQAKQSLAHWDKALSDWTDDNELWDCFVNKEWFQTVFTNGLSDYHSGDCTAFACGCSRCHAETMFKIPETVTWGKAEGSKMEHAFMKDIKEKRALKNKNDSSDKLE